MDKTPLPIPPHLNAFPDTRHSSVDSPYGRVPLQQPVPSASGIPPKHSTSHHASKPYNDQFWSLMSRQREVHDQERALWNTEREDLLERIRRLENRLHSYESMQSDKTFSQVKAELSKENNIVSKKPDLDNSSSKSAGNKVWRGPKMDLEPTPAFVNVTNHPITLSSRRLPSVPNIGAPRVDTNLDGITFKTNTSLSSSLIKDMKALLPASKSLSSPPTAKVTISLSPAKLHAFEDPNSKDAGHTPVALRSDYERVSGTSSPDATGSGFEKEQPPPETSRKKKQPSERSDSYFPEVETSQDNDPALSGPLGLTNSEPEDKHFFHEVDKGLARASIEPLIRFSSPPADTDTKIDKDQAGDKETGNNENENENEKPKEEPELKIKRSMNFGSAFGERNPGPDA